MTSAIRHRGPDDSGVFVEEEVGLGARRLAIIDIPHGAQPLANADRSVVIAYNGEIYNHGELRKELRREGRQFRTECDTEVVLALYECYGDDFVVSLAWNVRVCDC